MDAAESKGFWVARAAGFDFLEDFLWNEDAPVEFWEPFKGVGGGDQSNDRSGVDDDVTHWRFRMRTPRCPIGSRQLQPVSGI